VSRERLPNRRQQVTDSVWWNGRRIHVSAGFTDDGRLLEVFLRGGGKVGSERDHTLDDIAVVVSRLLQHGDQLDDIGRGLGRLPDGEPASVVGAVVDQLLAIERDEPCG
jgi:hypothetical protein